MRDYKASEGELIAKEMTDQLSLDLIAKHYVTESITLWVGYSKQDANPGALGTAQFSRPTNLSTEMVPAIAALYRRIVDSRFLVRRINLTCNRVMEDTGILQLNMFEDVSQQLRQKALQETLLGIRARYGKNSILKGMNYEEAATGRERNEQIGGHRRG
jgi:DNA polymerase V